MRPKPPPAAAWGLVAGLLLAARTGGAACPPVTAWTSTFNGSLNGPDRAYAEALTPGGDLVVAGTTDGGAWIASRLDVSGNTLWTVTGGGAPGLGSIARAVAVDASDNIVLAIEDDRTDIGHGKDWLIVSLDANGAFLASTPFNGAGSLDDAPTAITIDQFGLPTVVGYATSVANGESWMIRKYPDNLLGPPSWTATFDGPVAGGADRAAGVDIDNQNRIFVGGWETTAAQGTNWRIRVYDPGGGYLGWFFPSYNDPDNADDLVSALTVDSFGRVIVAGTEDRTGSGTGLDWRVIVYSSAGGQIWSSSYDSPASLDDTAHAVVADGCGNVIAAGSEDRADIGEGLNRVVRKWGPDGLVLWTVTESGPGADPDEYFAAVVLGTGEAVIAGMETRNDLGEGENMLVRSYGDGCASLVSSMEITPLAPVLCQPFTVTITITNTGNCLLSGLDAEATPPRIEGPAAFVSGPSGAAANPGQAASYSYTYFANGVGPVTISATATGLKQDTGAVISAGTVCAASAAVTGPAGPPDLAVAAGLAPPGVSTGGAMTFRWTVFNGSVDTAVNVVVTDTLPPGVGFAGCYGASCWQSSSIVTWRLGTVPMNASVVVSASVFAPGQGVCPVPPPWSPGDLGECAGIGFTNFCATAYWDSAPVCVVAPVLRNARVVPSVTASATLVAQDGPVTLTVRLENTCNDLATSVRVWDTVPAGATYVACAGAPCAVAGGIVSWTLPNLAAGSTYAVTFTVSLTGAGPYPRPEATAGFANAGLQIQPPVSATAPALAVVNPVLVVTKLGPATAMTGDQITWTLVVSNAAGQDTAWNIVLTDPLPAPLGFVAATGGGTAAGSVVSWPAFSLPPGAVAAAVTVTARAPVSDDSWDLENTSSALCVNTAGRPVTSAVARAALTLEPRLVLRVFPIPFNPGSARRGVLKFSGLPPDASVRIFTPGGRLVRELVTPVRHRLEWDGRNTDGADVAPGAYLYVITLPGADPVKGNFGVIR